MMRRLRNFLSALYVFVLLCFAPAVSWPGSTLIANDQASTLAEPGKIIPDFMLSATPMEEAKGYLGVSGAADFTAGQIKAKVLFIEVFSFYCPHCQRTAEQVNEIYRYLMANPFLKEDIKMIGIGVGNSHYEVDLYRNRYRVPFPLFPDPNSEIAQVLGAKATPTFIAIRLHDHGLLWLSYFEEGEPGEASLLLSKIAELSGLKIKVGERKER